MSAKEQARIRQYVADQLISATAEGAAAERKRCCALVCEHCRRGSAPERAANGWRHTVAGCRVPCRAAALQGEGPA